MKKIKKKINMLKKYILIYFLIFAQQKNQLSDSLWLKDENLKSSFNLKSTPNKDTLSAESITKENVQNSNSILPSLIENPEEKLIKKEKKRKQKISMMDFLKRKIEKNRQNCL